MGLYIPTPSCAIGVYTAAAANHSNLLPSVLCESGQVNVNEMPSGVYRILIEEKYDASDRLVDGLAICLYDNQTALWYVRLPNAEIVRVCDKGDGFVVVTD